MASRRETLSRSHLTSTQFRVKKRREEPYYEAKLFTTRGAGLSEVSSLEQILDWFVPLNRNEDELGCKIYSLLKLRFSKTYSTITFAPHQIHEIDDTFEDGTPEDNQFNDSADYLD